MSQNHAYMISSRIQNEAVYYQVATSSIGQWWYGINKNDEWMKKKTTKLHAPNNNKKDQTTRLRTIKQ